MTLPLNGNLLMRLPPNPPPMACFPEHPPHIGRGRKTVHVWEVSKNNPTENAFKQRRKKKKRAQHFLFVVVVLLEKREEGMYNPLEKSVFVF
jgi:hypothetical protein